MRGVDFNYTQDLWETERASALSRPNGGPVYTIFADGTVGDGYLVITRFSCREGAHTVLNAAGFRCIETTPEYSRFKAQR